MVSATTAPACGVSRSERGVFGLRFRRRIPVAQTHERGAQKPALKRVTRTNGFGDDRTGLRRFLAARDLVAFDVERLIGFGGKRCEAEAARGVAAGILERR